MAFEGQYHTAASGIPFTPADWNTEMSRIYGQLNEVWDGTILDTFSGTGTARTMYFADASLELQLLGRDKADANQFFVGMGNGNEGELITRGLVTGFSGLTNGAEYYLGLGGGVVSDIPSYGAGQWVLYIGKAIGATNIFVDIRQDDWQRR
jgi:hypothetical protein